MKDFICFVMITFSLQVFAAAQTPSTDTVSVVPMNEVLPVIVAQSNCPLIIERFIVVRHQDGTIRTEYRIRNKGKKVVKYYRIARWYSDNTGFVQYGAMPKQKPFRSNTFVDTLGKNVLELSADQKEKNRPMKKIAFIMVLEIGFTDGSVFDANAAFGALTEHLQRFESIYDTPR